MDFDLTIENYSLNDLVNFFQLKPQKKKYTPSDIELAEYELRTKILSSGQLNKEFQHDLIEFLDSAKDLLINGLCPKPTTPTSIPANYKLDTSDHPRVREEPPTREQEVVVKQPTPFVYSQPSEFFPGKLNPLDTRIVTRCLNIDTRFRKNIYSTQSSDFTIQLPTKFNKVVSMQLASLEFPVTFYSTSESFGNNYLYIKIQHYPLSSSGVDLSGSLITVDRIVNVPEGNYNAQDFIDKINTVISPRNADDSLQNAYDPFGYVQFSLDITSTGSGTGKVTVKSNGLYKSAIHKIGFDFKRNKDKQVDQTDVATRIGWNLGFIKPTYDLSFSHTGETIVEPCPTRYIYLAVDDFQNNSPNHFINVFEQSIMSPNILARISLKASYFSLLMENDLPIVTEPRKYFGPVDIQRLRIRLYDERGRLLNMNNSNWSCCLNLTLLYDL